MSKISTYDVAPLPKLSDRLIGTSVGGTPYNKTYNFTLQELLDLFIPNISTNTLQGVLDYGNTATQDINLIGTVYTTDLEVSNLATILDSYLTGDTHIQGTLFDYLDLPGTVGQVLTSTGSGIEWTTFSALTPDLQQVLTVGNTSTVDIILTADLSALDVSSDTATFSNDLTIDGTLTDGAASVGAVGKVLSSTGTGVQWIDLPLYTATSPLSIDSITRIISIQQSGNTQAGYLSSSDWINFDGKQPAGNYITALTGEATASGPGSVAITLTNSAVIGKVLTGLNVTGGTVIAADSILSAFGKVQNQINGLIGGSVFQGVWDASTNTPALVSSVGTNGHYYIVSVAGSTNLNGITDWKIGDWAIFAGTSWQKVDNTDAVSSVNGYTGTVSLVTGDVFEGVGSLPSRPLNLYFTDARARSAISLTTTGSSGASTYNSTTGVLNIPNYTDAFVGTVTSVAALTLGTSGSDLNSSVANGTTTPVITLNVPDASASARGVVTIGTQTFGGEKTLINRLSVNVTNDICLYAKGTGAGAHGVVGEGTAGYGGWFFNTGTGNEVLRVESISLTGALATFINTNGLVATISNSGNITGNSFIKTGGTSSQFLKADGSVDTTTYQGAITLAAIGASPNANAATLSSGTLTLQPASASFGGVMTTGTQTISGLKTFENSGITANFNRTVLGGAIVGFQILGVDKSFIEWNVNDAGSAAGTAMNLRNNQGAIGLYDSTNTGLKISGGSGVFAGSSTATAFIPTGSTIPVNGMYLSAANTLNFATNSVNRLSISLTGDTAIGIASASERLHLANSTNGYVGLRLEGTGDYAGSDWTMYASSNSAPSADDFLGFYNNSATDGATVGYKFTLNKTGAATFSSNITSTGFIKTGSGEWGTFNSTASGASSGYYYQSYGTDSGSAVIRWYVGQNAFRTDGSFAIQNVTGTGLYLTSGSTSWTSTSDERSKDIIRPITNALKDINSWRTVIGKYKNDEIGKERIFLIAQDILVTTPQVVDVSDEGNLGLRYLEIIPILVKGIQELKAEIDILKNK